MWMCGSSSLDSWASVATGLSIPTPEPFVAGIVKLQSCNNVPFGRIPNFASLHFCLECSCVQDRSICEVGPIGSYLPAEGSAQSPLHIGAHMCSCICPLLKLKKATLDPLAQTLSVITRWAITVTNHFRNAGKLTFAQAKWPRHRLPAAAVGTWWAAAPASPPQHRPLQLPGARLRRHRRLNRATPASCMPSSLPSLLARSAHLTLRALCAVHLG